jgi:hypothetical protein
LRATRVFLQRRAQSLGIQGFSDNRNRRRSIPLAIKRRKENKKKDKDTTIARL